MATFTRFEEITAWQEARELSKMCGSQQVDKFPHRISRKERT